MARTGGFLMACCEFEAKIQVECVMDVVGIVRSGELMTKRADVLQHVGCIIGSLGAYLDDDNDEAFASADAFDVPCTLEDCCDELEAQCGGDAMTAPGPIVMMLIKQIIRLLIEQLL